MLKYLKSIKIGKRVTIIILFVTIHRKLYNYINYYNYIFAKLSRCLIAIANSFSFLFLLFIITRLRAVKISASSTSLNEPRSSSRSYRYPRERSASTLGTRALQQYRRTRSRATPTHWRNSTSPDPAWRKSSRTRSGVSVNCAC